MNEAAQPARKSASVCLAYIVFLTAAYHLGTIAAAILCVVFALVICIFASKRIGTVLAILLVAASALGLFSMTAYTLQRNSIAERYAWVSAHCSGTAENVTLKDDRDRIILQVDTIDGEKAPAFFRTALYVPAGTGVRIGDKVSADLKFYAIEDMDDFPSRLYFDGEAVSLYSHADRISREREFSVLGLAADVREYVKTRFDEYLPATSELAAGIMLGDKSGIGDDVYGVLSANGITHVLCVSGLHISILISVFGFLLARTNISKRAKRISVCAFALFYMFLTGFSVSVCRAGIMAAVTTCDNITRRRPDSMTTLLLTATALCLFSPYTVLNLSFRLSFLATAGVIAAGQNIVPAIRKKLGNKAPAKICSHVLGVICISVCAVSVCVPVLSVYIAKQSILSPLGNLFCAPIAEVYLVMCFLLVPLSYVPFVGTFFGTATDFCGLAFLKVSELLSKSAVFLDISSKLLSAISTGLVLMLILCYIFDVKNRRGITLMFSAASVVLMIAASI